MRAIFFYHSGMSALVLPGPDGKPWAIATKTLRAHGWKALDGDLQQALPRFDQPQLAIAPAGALRGLKAMGLDQPMRRR
jgi:hypothetical protein